MTITPNPSTPINVDQLGPAGIRGELHIVARFENDQRKDTDRLTDTSNRKFKISARLGKVPLAAEDIKGDFTPEDGGSFLILPVDVDLTRVQCPDGVFEFRKNSNGEQSYVEFECTGGTRAEAREKFLTAVLPFLDLMAYISNSPIFVVSLRVEDLKNQTISLEYVSPYRKVIINPHVATLLPEMRPVYALYREARNSNSDFYKFLCYHKLLEGLLGPLRADVYKKARERGITISLDRELVPDSPEIHSPYREHVGKSIKEFFDGVLTPRFRNAVAHFITEDGGVLNMSSSEHIDSYAEVMFVLELCVRKVVDNYEQLLTQLERGK